MTKDYIKFIKKSQYRQVLEKLISDLAHNNIPEYDCIKMWWYTNRYRIRVGKIRCIFEIIQWENFIIEINNRGDIY